MTFLSSTTDLLIKQEGGQPINDLSNIPNTANINYSGDTTDASLSLFEVILNESFG
jgi:hypothetical protein